MRMFARTVSSLLASAVVLSFGCSSEVKIGAVISETGAVAPYGAQVTRGMDLALEEINAEGGHKGGPVQLIYRDDATNTDTGVEAVNDLIANEGVDVIIGAVSSPVTLAIAPICERKRRVLLSPTSSAPRISEAGEYVFRNYPSDILEGTAMADFAKKRGVRRVVIIALDNEFGSGLSEVFTRRFESKSREVVKTFRIEEDDTGGFAELIAEVKDLTPQGIYIVAYVETMTELLKQAQAQECMALMMGSGSVTDQLVGAAGEAAEGLVYAQPAFDPDSEVEAVASFVSAFRTKYHREPDIYAAHGYDSVKLIMQAIRDTNSTFPDEIKRGLYGLKDYSGAAGKTQFDERGDVVRYPTVFVIKDGASMTYAAFEEGGGELPIPEIEQ